MEVASPLHAGSMETIRKDPSPQQRLGLPAFFAAVSGDERQQQQAPGSPPRQAAPPDPPPTSRRPPPSPLRLPEPPPLPPQLTLEETQVHRTGLPSSDAWRRPSPPNTGARSLNSSTSAWAANQDREAPIGSEARRDEAPDGNSASAATRLAGRQPSNRAADDGGAVAQRQRLGSETLSVGASGHGYRHQILEARLIASRSVRSNRANSFHMNQSREEAEEGEVEEAKNPAKNPGNDDRSARERQAGGRDDACSSVSGSSGGGGGADVFDSNFPLTTPGESSSRIFSSSKVGGSSDSLGTDNDGGFNDGFSAVTNRFSPERNGNMNGSRSGGKEARLQGRGLPAEAPPLKFVSNGRAQQLRWAYGDLVADAEPTFQPPQEQEQQQQQMQQQQQQSPPLLQKQQQPPLERARSVRYLKNMAKAKALERRGLTSSAPRTGEFPDQLLSGVKLQRAVVMLLSVGVLAGLAAHLVEAGIRALENLRDNVLLQLTDSYGLKFLLFWGYMVVGTAAAVLLTAAVAPEAAGSGIPVMKYLMGTDEVRQKTSRQFSLRALFVKCAGLTLAAGAGMNVGREGPFTHVAGMVSWLLMKHVSIFEPLYNSEVSIRAALSASVAVGVSTTFTSVIGGVLFSIEITSTYYRVDNYFKGFLASLGGAVAVQLAVRVFNDAQRAKSYVSPTDFTSNSYNMYEYPLFLAIGAVMGALGPLYVRMRLYFMRYLRGLSLWEARRKPSRKNAFVRRAVLVGAAVATATAIPSFFPGPYAREGPFRAFSTLLTLDPLGDAWSGGLGGIWLALPVSAVVRAFTAALGTSIVVPAGDFILTAVIGASLGRLVGELVALGDSSAVPATYALLAAAALAGSVTQTISAAVVLLEFTGGWILAVPTIMTTIMACGVSYLFGFNLYDSIIRINGLDWLPGLRPQSDAAETRVARDIMLGAEKLRVLTAEPTLGEITALLEDRSCRFESFPVVGDKESMAFLGTIHRQDLARILETRARREEFLLERLRERLPDDLGSGIDASNSRSWLATISRLVQSTTRTIGRNWQQQNQSSFGNNNNNNSNNYSVGYGDSIGGAAAAYDASGDFQQFGRRRSSAEPRRLNLMILEQGGWDPARMEEEAAESFSRQTVNLLVAFADDELSIDTSPWSVPGTQALNHLHVLFELLRIPRLFVVSGGQLLGVITRQALVDAVAGTRPTNRMGSVRRAGAAGLHNPKEATLPQHRSLRQRLQLSHHTTASSSRSRFYSNGGDGGSPSALAAAAAAAAPMFAADEEDLSRASKGFSGHSRVNIAVADADLALATAVAMREDAAAAARDAVEGM